MAIADQAGLQTAKYLEDRLPHILGAKNVQSVVDGAIETSERRIIHLLGAPDVQSLVATTVDKAKRELDDLLSKHRDKLRDEIIDHTVTRIRRETAGLINAELDLLVQKTGLEAKKLVAESLKLVTLEVTDPFAKQMAAAADKLATDTLNKTALQLDGRVDKITAAIERLNPSKLLWQAGLVFGLVNVATVIAAVWIAKHM